ncbi:hypothetical protein C4D60_Mb02t23350 [Musa balbisiana]|uniref:Uncharacterized protein n=1 Tax=Musa balbisiana TaxID=52838 RepID=A0A4S8IDM7_MUSBA|nr:hypothetical protein C4D60_Mb02t23350 [Musa balbisiana]
MKQCERGATRLEGNPLDLNSLPEEHGKQPLEESSMTTAASADITQRETETLNRARQLVFSNDVLEARKSLPGASNIEAAAASENHVCNSNPSTQVSQTRHRCHSTCTLPPPLARFLIHRPTNLVIRITTSVMSSQGGPNASRLTTAIVLIPALLAMELLFLIASPWKKGEHQQPEASNSDESVTGIVVTDVSTITCIVE